MSELTLYEYEYLTGNTKFWLYDGPAYNRIKKLCSEQGLGVFGAPTEDGLRAMSIYEDSHVR